MSRLAELGEFPAWDSQELEPYLRAVRQEAARIRVEVDVEARMLSVTMNLPVEQWCHTCPDIPHRVEHPGQLCPTCEGTEAPL